MSSTSDANDEFTTSSSLYHIEPYGKGMPVIQSFTSYLVDTLARAHNVEAWTITDELILPFLDSNRLAKQGWSACKAWLDGSPTLTPACVQKVETLTGCKDLHNLTVVHWPEIIFNRIIRKEHARCIRCCDEWNSKKLDLYTPLLWRVSAVTHCPLHRTRLITNCPYPDCGVELRITNTGSCLRCKRQLHEGPLTTEQSSGSEYGVWCARQIGLLIEKAQSHTEHWLSRQEWYSKLDAMAYSIMRLGTSGLANKYLNLHSGMLVGGAKKNLSLHLETLLSIANSLQISLIDVLRGDIDKSPKFVITESTRSHGVRCSRTSAEIEQELEAILREAVPQRKHEVEARIGCSEYRLKKMFPVQWAAICQRSHQSKTKSLPPSEEELARTRKVLATYLSIDPPLSLRQIALGVGWDKYHLEKHFKLEWTQLRERYHKWHRKQSDTQRKPMNKPNKGSVETGLATMLSEGIYTSMEDVGNQLGCSPSYIRRHFREQNDQLIAQLRLRQAKRKADAQNQLILELREFVLNLHNQGVSQIKSRVDKKFGAKMLRPWLQEALIQLMIELGYREAPRMAEAG